MEVTVTMPPSDVSRNAAPGQLCIEGRRLIRSGALLRIARIHDEIWLEGDLIPDPERFVSKLRQVSQADIFTFAQRLPNVEPLYFYHAEMDNISLASTADYQAWWSSLPQESRKNVRRSQRRGVTVRLAEFDEALVRGIKLIYDETPLRQGRRFPHFRKAVEVVRDENSSYLDRSHFIGAYFEEQLIGFIKMVRVGQTARIMQIISLNSHYDKRPTNALLAKAMEICAAQERSHLIYGQHVYDNKVDSSVTEFKKRNGFSQAFLPRYYLPLTTKGKIALALGLHKGIKERLPASVRDAALAVRTSLYEKTVLRNAA